MPGMQLPHCSATGGMGKPQEAAYMPEFWESPGSLELTEVFRFWGMVLCGLLSP